ncbi:hypothetical protein HanIR_Chr08g0384251 [Helianthus annuus]|nr:hypothetical protein HanIR_Chr08g0384251 [Helianthus annuus]
MQPIRRLGGHAGRVRVNHGFTRETQIQAINSLCMGLHSVVENFQSKRILTTRNHNFT